jgi:hypothetical protein
LGYVNLQDIKNANKEYNKLTGSITRADDEERYEIVLAQIFIKKFHSYMVDDSVDIPKIDVTKLNLEHDHNDIFYICKPHSTDLSENNSHEKSTHIFAVKDFTKIKYLSIVTFSSNDVILRCGRCNEIKEEKYTYCHNDEKYFCTSCDDEVHVKANNKIFFKHKRISYASFTITHQLTCKEHILKPYEFYCLKCKAVYCIKCLTDGTHKSDHQIKYLDEVFNSVDSESRSVIKILILAF